MNRQFNISPFITSEEPANLTADTQRQAGYEWTYVKLPVHFESFSSSSNS